MDATITDLSGDIVCEITDDADMVTAQGQLVIPLVAIFGKALIEALIKAGLFIIVFGLEFIIVGEIINEIKNKSNEYYQAHVVPNKNIYIGPAMNEAAALEWVKLSTGHDVLAKNQLLAFSLSKAANMGRTPVGPELGSGPGVQMWHYHPYDRFPNVHILFP